MSPRSRGPDIERSRSILDWGGRDCVITVASSDSLVRGDWSKESGVRPALAFLPSTERARARGPQLELVFESPAEILTRRLYALGLPSETRIRGHGNRRVMVSWSPGGVLRIHRGYSRAPDQVLQAIVRFLAPETRGTARLEARRELLQFQIEDIDPLSPSRRAPLEPARPGDQQVLDRLTRLHEFLNHRYFQGRLPPIRLRLSARMKRRLGELALDRQSGAATEITLSRRHLRRDGWAEVEQTLLHEMVHQWQAESGLPVDHGREFRQKALEVGIQPRAVAAEVRRTLTVNGQR